MKNIIMKRVLSGMTVLTLLFQPMSFQAKENLTEKVSDVNILMQEPMNELFQQDGTEDAFVENLEYKYKFKESKGDSLNATVNMIIDMQVLGNEYRIKAEGEVSGEKLSSGDVLWMGPLTGDVLINDIEYLVLVGFTRMNDDVQVSVTIQEKDGNEEIEPVMFSFGDTVITEAVYQEIIEERENLLNETDTSRSRAASTFAMDRVPISADSGNFRLETSKTVNFTTSSISGYGQALYGYYDRNYYRVAISLKSYCSNLEKYYSGIGHATSEIESMKYTLKTGNAKNLAILGADTFDFNIKNFGKYSPIMGMFSDAFALLSLNVPMSTISAILSGLKGYITEEGGPYSKTVTVKFGAADHANFDSCTKGIPIVFQMVRSSAGTQDLTLQTSISYRTLVQVNGTTGYTVYYNSAKTATSNISVSVI